MPLNSLATPLTKGSQPMKPTSGRSGRARQQVLAAAEAYLQPKLARIREQPTRPQGRKVGLDARQ